MEAVLLRRRAAIVPWRPRNPPSTWPSRQRPGETAGERRRGRRYGADVPTLTSPDFVLTSGAQVAPTCGAVARGLRRASGARASAAVGAMAVLVLRSRSSRCHRLSVERPPVHATAHSDPATLPYKAVAPATPQPPTVIPAKAGIHRAARGAIPYVRPPAPTPRPSPHMAVAPATRRSQGQHQRPQVRTLLAPLQRRQNCLVPATRRSRPTSPHSVVSSAAPSAWPPGRCTRPCWRSCSVPPPGATPSSPICGRHPLGQPARQGTQTEVNQRRIIQQPRQGCPRRETIAVLPPGQLQKTTKNTKQSYKGRLIIRHFCSPRRPSPPMKCPATLPHKAVAPPQRGR